MKKLSLHQLINSNSVSQSDVHTTIDNLTQTIIQANRMNVSQFNSKEDMFGSIMRFISDYYTFDVVKTKVATHILCNPK
jgi:hypothetical protein